VSVDTPNVLSPPHPAQWLIGRSGGPYFLGLYAVAAVAFYAGELVAGAALPSNPGPPDFTISMLRFAVTASIGIPAVMLYVAFVARPLPIGVSPFGLTVNFGMAYRYYNWRNIHVARSTIYCFSDRGGLPFRVAASRDQLAVVNTYLQQVHAWAGWTLSGRVADINRRPPGRAPG
jgi:hypothetical protein